MGYCNQCGGKLQPDMLFVTEDGHQRQRMRCKGTYFNYYYFNRL